MYILPEELARELQQNRELAAHWDEIKAFFDSLDDFKVPPVNEGQADIAEVGSAGFADHFDFGRVGEHPPDGGPDDGPNPWPGIIKDLIDKGPIPDFPDLPVEAIKGLDLDVIPVEVFEMGL